MDVTTERLDGVLLVLVSGRIDNSNADALEEAVRDGIEGSDRTVIMDLEKLSYISSAGLRVLLTTAKDLLSRDGGLMLCSMSDRVRVPVERVGVDRMIPIYPSRAEALASLNALRCWSLG